jgi:hypothetical protein
MLVFEVTSLNVHVMESNPPIVRVTAKGMTRTLGWTNPRLEPVVYARPPADGIQDLEFHADPPSGGIGQALEEIESKELDMGLVPEWMRGVRVIAETNQKAEQFSGEPVGSGKAA